MDAKIWALASASGGAGMTIAFFCFAAYRKWRDRRLAATRIAVIPTLRIENDERKFVVRVINNSDFEVVIDRAAVEVKFDNKRKAYRAPFEAKRPGLPLALPPRASREFELSLRGAIALSKGSFKEANVDTASGKRFKTTRRCPYHGLTMGDILQRAGAASTADVATDATPSQGRALAVWGERAHH